MTGNITRPRVRTTATAADDNRSWNCGVEGPTDDPSIDNLLVYFSPNAYWDQLEFELPLIANDKAFWHRWIDTYLDSSG